MQLAAASVGLDNLAKAVLVSCHCRVKSPHPPPSNPYCATWKEIVQSPYFGAAKWRSPFLWVQPTIVTWSTPAQKFVSAPYHLFSQGFCVVVVVVVVSSMGYVYLFYNLGHNLISHFLAQIVPAQATGCSFSVPLRQAGMSSWGSSVCVITLFLSGT